MHHVPPHTFLGEITDPETYSCNNNYCLGLMGLNFSDTQLLYRVAQKTARFHLLDVKLI